MSTTRNGRRPFARIQPRADAEAAAAQVAAEVIDLTRRGLADPRNGWKHISDARALAVVLQGLTSYVAMFERGS